MVLFYQIDGYPCYFVGDDLKIYSNMSGELKSMKFGFDRRYYNITLCKKGCKRKTFNVHRLIAKAFIPNPDNLPLVDHINGNKTDNRLENLRWATAVDNVRNTRIAKNNNSGFQGVFFDNTNKQWTAKWCEENRRHRCKRFSIKKYGDQAKQLAIDYRKMKVDELYNRV